MTLETRAPRTHWCWLCRRALLHDDDDAVRVIAEGRDEWVCGRCFNKTSPDLPLSYEEDDREGQPEFNGAFNAW